MDTLPKVVTLHGGPAIALRRTLTMAELPTFFGESFRELAACALGHAQGPPFARYHRVTPEVVDVEVVQPLSTPVPIRGSVRAIMLVDGPAVQVLHQGPYEELHLTYNTIEHWLAEHHRATADALREIYVTGPWEGTEASRWLTIVVQPVSPDEQAA